MQSVQLNKNNVSHSEWNSRNIIAASDFLLDISSCARNQNIKSKYNKLFKQLKILTDHLSLGFFGEKKNKIKRLEISLFVDRAKVKLRMSQ